MILGLVRGKFRAGLRLAQTDVFKTAELCCLIYNWT
jgi:hypothetical protein